MVKGCLRIGLGRALFGCWRQTGLDRGGGGGVLLILPLPFQLVPLCRFPFAPDAAFALWPPPSVVEGTMELAVKAPALTGLTPIAPSDLGLGARLSVLGRNGGRSCLTGDPCAVPRSSCSGRRTAALQALAALRSLR